MKIDKYLPKEKDFALIKIKHESLYFVEESDDLDYLLRKQDKPELDSSFYVIDKQSKFQHKLSLHQSMDLQSVKI